MDARSNPVSKLPVVQLCGLIERDDHIEPPEPDAAPEFYGIYVRDDQDPELWMWKQDFGTRDAAIRYATDLAKSLNGDWYER